MANSNQALHHQACDSTLDGPIFPQAAQMDPGPSGIIPCNQLPSAPDLNLEAIGAKPKHLFGEFDRSLTETIASFDPTGKGLPAMINQDKGLWLNIQEQEAILVGGLNDITTTNNSIFDLLRVHLEGSQNGKNLLDLAAEEANTVVTLAMDMVPTITALVMHQRYILSSGFSMLLAGAATKVQAQEREIAALKAMRPQSSSPEMDAQKAKQIQLMNGLLRAEVNNLKASNAAMRLERDRLATRLAETQLLCQRYDTHLEDLDKLSNEFKRNLAL